MIGRIPWKLELKNKFMMRLKMKTMRLSARKFKRSVLVPQIFISRIMFQLWVILLPCYLLIMRTNTFPMRCLVRLATFVKLHRCRLKLMLVEMLLLWIFLWWTKWRLHEGIRVLPFHVLIEMLGMLIMLDIFSMIMVLLVLGMILLMLMMMSLKLVELF